MLSRQPDRRHLTVLASCGLALTLAGSGAAQEDDPWTPLRTVRERLTHESPLAAEFIQEYVPAGFSSGEQENGRLLLGLPDCLRWEYREPYPRNYLLCARTVWAWSPDEPVGDRLRDISEDEAGLDFLLLSAERLAARYTATAAHDDTSVHMTLTPRTDEAPFREARITLDLAAGRPALIAYRDREGNETRFTLTLFRPLADRGLLAPPDGVEWIDG